MQKEFLINILLLVGINLLIKPFYAFGIDLQVQNQLGMSDYGLYYALFNFSYLFQIISDFGIQQYNSRFIAQHPKLLSKYLPHFLIIKGILSIVFFGLSLVTALFLGYFKANIFPVLILLLLNQVLITLIFYLRSNISGLHLFRTDSLLSALDKLLLIIIMSLMLWGPWKNLLTIQSFVYAQTFTLFFTAIIVWMILKSNINGKIFFKWNPSILISVFRQSWPYALAVFLMTAYTRLDAVMIERMLSGKEGEFQSGVYAYAYRLIDAFNMIGFLFASLLLPMYARLLKNNDALTDLLRTAYQWMFFMTIVLSFGVLFFGDELTYWILKEASPYAVSVFKILVWSSISSGVIYVFGTLLTSSGNLKKMNRVFAIGFLLNLIGNLIMIPRYGAWGAAISTLITQSFVAVVELFLVYQSINSSRALFRITELVKIIALCFGIWLIYGLSDNYLQEWLDWRIAFLIASISGLAWAESIGFVQLKGFLKIIKSKKE